MQSMTGCGTGRVQRNGWEVTAEIKSVNHRFLDLGLRLPRNIAFLEPVVREETGKTLKRGHVDVFLTVRSTESSAVQISVDEELARQYCETGKVLEGTIGAEYDMSVSKLLAMEGVVTLTEKEMDQSLISAMCAEALRTALEQMTVMRGKEGAHLKEDLRIHLDAVAELRLKVLERAPKVITEYREKLGERLIVQCFDTRALNYMHQKWPALTLSYLTEAEEGGDIGKLLDKLDFTPRWWSPESSVVTPENVAWCHAHGIGVVPWTVDDPAEMRRLVACGVEAIISNYPDILIRTVR